MSNAASTWIGLILGIAVGAFITWVVYKMQNKTSEKQERIIKDIDKMVKKMKSQEEMHRTHQEKVLDMLQTHQENVLDKILR